MLFSTGEKKTEKGKCGVGLRFIPLPVIPAAGLI